MYNWKKQIKKTKPDDTVERRKKLGLPKMKDINSMTTTEIREGIKHLREVVMSGKAESTRFGGAMSNPGQVQQSKRTIARMMTVLARRTV